MTRDAALKHIYELDPAAGREMILRDLENVAAQPSMEVIKLLHKEDLAIAIGPAVERIGKHRARELDYQLIDQYAESSALGIVQSVFEARLGTWACAPQSAMLRYFLRVAPEYGVKQVRASLAARKDTGCYRFQLHDLGAELPKVEQIAVDALDDSDPEVVQNAVQALGRWGNADAERALWMRLERFPREWDGRQDELRLMPDYQSSGSRGTTLEQALVTALAAGTNWDCPPDKLARLAELVWTKGTHRQIDGWIKRRNDALINPNWFPEDSPTFSLLQYDGLNGDQLLAKMAQLPRGTQLRWQFWQPGQISPPVTLAKQESVYERVRVAAEKHGIVLAKANHP
jgi:hypothetical protein